MLYLDILAVLLVGHDEEQTEWQGRPLHHSLKLLSSTVHNMLSVTEIRYTFYNAECIC